MTLLAGLYRMEEHGGLQVPVFSVITWKATEELKAIHDRMPLILSYEDALDWIRPDSDPQEIVERAVRDLIFEKETG